VVIHDEGGILASASDFWMGPGRLSGRATVRGTPPRRGHRGARQIKPDAQPATPRSGKIAGFL